MTVLLIISVLLLLMLAVLLWAPLVLELDSRRSVYRLDWWYLLQAHVTPAPDDLFIHGRILFFKKRWSVIELLAKQREKKEKKAEKKQQRKKKRHFSWDAVKRILHTFTVHRFDIALDTGDVITNAMLFPLAEVLHHSLRVSHTGFHVNFTGDNHIDLKISNRAGRVAWAFIPSFITT